MTGGEWRCKNTGSAPAQYDIHIDLPGGTSIALEHTSYGDDDWRRTAATIAKTTMEGRSLKSQWWVVVRKSTTIKDLDPKLEALLAELEGVGIDSIVVGGARDELREPYFERLSALGVSSAGVVSEAVDGEQSIYLLLADRDTGSGGGAVTTAIESVFAKGDNQNKLAAAECDERHLFILLAGVNADAVLGQGTTAYLPPCPKDPQAVVDVVWLYSPSFASAWLFRGVPGRAEWERFVEATGIAG